MSSTPQEKRMDWQTEMLLHKSNADTSLRATANHIEKMQTRLVEEIQVRDALIETQKKTIETQAVEIKKLKPKDPKEKLPGRPATKTELEKGSEKSPKN